MTAPGGPVVAVAVALLVWPGPAARARGLASSVAGSRLGVGPDRTVAQRCSEGARRCVARCAAAPPAVPLVAAAVVGGLLAGAGGALGGALVGLVVRRARRAARRARDDADDTRALAEALGAFATELRSGAPPAAAARAAAADAHGATAAAFRLVEATARLGGEVPVALRAGATPGPRGDGLRRLAEAWVLAERHGLGLAGLAGAVATDLDVRARFAARTRAQVAGPRATAVVLAVLPVLGLLLGEGIGAAPWAVLSGTGVGQVLLVVGVALVGAGLEWTERIVAGVTR